MSDSPKSTPAKSAERTAREVRLAEALRDNLRRRKEQARARAADHDSADTSAAPSGRRWGDAGSTG